MRRHGRSVKTQGFALGTDLRSVARLTLVVMNVIARQDNRDQSVGRSFRSNLRTRSRSKKLKSSYLKRTRSSDTDRKHRLGRKTNKRSCEVESME